VATLTRRKGHWQLGWSDPAGRHRISLGPVAALTPRQAEAILKRKELELSTGAAVLGLSFAQAPFFGQYAEDYLAWHELEYPASHARVRQVTWQYLLPRWQYTRLDALPEREVEQMKQDRRREGAKAHTVAKELRILRAILNRAVAQRLIDANPIANVAAPRILDAKPHRFYEADELARLYAACRGAANGGAGPQPDPRHAWIWKLYANTGARRMEGLQLRRRWIGQDGLKIISTGEERTKSGEWREIPLTLGAREALAALAGGGEYVLPRVHPSSLSRAAIKDARRAGLDGSLHTLRHTYVSHLIRAGIPMRTVQLYAGHAHYSTTEGYAYLVPGVTPRLVSELAL
jgi:integrase